MTQQWSFLSGLRGLRRLGPRGVLSALSTAAWACVVEAALRTGRTPQIARRLGVPLDQATPAGAPGAPLALTPAEKRSLRTVRRVLSHRPFNGTCLRQALLVGHALRARRPVLRIGVRKADGELLAHAWVEIDGYAIDRYTVIPVDRSDFLILQPVARHGSAAWKDLR